MLAKAIFSTAFAVILGVALTQFLAKPATAKPTNDFSTIEFNGGAGRMKRKPYSFWRECGIPAISASVLAWLVMWLSTLGGPR